MNVVAENGWAVKAFIWFWGQASEFLEWEIGQGISNVVGTAKVGWMEVSGCWAGISVSAHELHNGGRMWFTFVRDFYDSHVVRMNKNFWFLSGQFVPPKNGGYDSGSWSPDDGDWKLWGHESEPFPSVEADKPRRQSCIYVELKCPQGGRRSLCRRKKSFQEDRKCCHWCIFILHATEQNNSMKERWDGCIGLPRDSLIEVDWGTEFSQGG